MKLKRCRCRMCQLGLRTKTQSELVKIQVRSARHRVKSLIKTDYLDLDELADALENLPTEIGLDYTD